MESMGNNIMLREFQLLLKECMDNEKISRSIILKKRINYIYSVLESNPICRHGWPSVGVSVAGHRSHRRSALSAGSLP